MKKELKLVYSILLVSLLLISFVSASSFSSFWNKITGNAVVPVCGNNRLEGEEQCDGNTFLENKLACFQWSKDKPIGVVSCNPKTCEIDFSSCLTIKEFSESSSSIENSPSVDLSVISSSSATSTSPTSTTPTETVSVTVPTTTIVQTETTSSATSTSLTSTQVQTIETTQICGNNKVEGDEECDGTSFWSTALQCTNYLKLDKPSQTIIGTVSCNSKCKIDTNNCKIFDNCQPEGKIVVDKTECCSGETTTQCSFLFFGCKKYCTKPLPFCGNNVINEGEQCDGQNLNGKTCADLGYDSGTLSCKNCKYTGCYNRPKRPQGDVENPFSDQKSKPKTAEQEARDEQAALREYYSHNSNTETSSNSQPAAAGENPDCVGMACPN